MDAPMNDVQPSSEPQIHSIRDYMGNTSKRANLYRPETKPKIISVGNLHYRDTQGKIQSVSTSFAKFVESNEQPLQRSFRVGEQWVPLELAWVKDCGYLLLRNDGDKQFQVVPTEEQRNEELAHVIEVGCMVKSSLPDFVEGSIEQVPLKRTVTHHDKLKRIDQVKEVIPPIMVLWYIDVFGKLEGRPSKEPLYLRCQSGETTLTMMATPV